jgi:hypothetical protein
MLPALKKYKLAFKPYKSVWEIKKIGKVPEIGNTTFLKSETFPYALTLTSSEFGNTNLQTQPGY